MHKTYGSKKESSSQDSKAQDSNEEGCKAQDDEESYEALTSLVCPAKALMLRRISRYIVLCPTFKKVPSGAFLILKNMRRSNLCPALNPVWWIG